MVAAPRGRNRKKKKKKERKRKERKEKKKEGKKERNRKERKKMVYYPRGSVLTERVVPCATKDLPKAP